MRTNSAWRQRSANDRDSQPCYFRKSLDGSETCEIVFFHGVLRAWNACLPLAAHVTQDYEAWALDHRGHGRSARAERYLLVDYVADAEAWLRTTVVAGDVVRDIRVLQDRGRFVAVLQGGIVKAGQLAGC